MFKKICSTLIIGLSLALTGCYDDNLQLEKVSESAQSKVVALLKDAGIEEVRCPTPREAHTDCYIFDGNLEISTTVINRIKWHSGDSLYVSPSLMGQFTPEELAQVFIKSYEQQKADPKKIEKWHSAI